MRFKIEEPATPLFVNIIKAVFWLIRIFLLTSFVWFVFTLVTAIIDLVETEMFNDYIRALFKREETISPLWLLFPASWFVGWCVQKYLKPWVKYASGTELCDLFQKAKDYPVINTYLREVSRKRRMISRKEYYYLDRMVKGEVKKKYWQLGKQ